LDNQFFAGDGVGEDGACHCPCMDFQEAGGYGGKDELLSREDYPFKVPIGNVGNSHDLHLAGGIDVEAGNSGRYLGAGGQKFVSWLFGLNLPCHFNNC
jgi:hypothetical protein